MLYSFLLIVTQALICVAEGFRLNYLILTALLVFMVACKQVVLAALKIED